MKLSITVNLVEFKDRFPPFDWVGNIVYPIDLQAYTDSKVFQMFKHDEDNLYNLRKSKGGRRLWYKWEEDVV